MIFVISKMQNLHSPLQRPINRIQFYRGKFGAHRENTVNQYAFLLKDFGKLFLNSYLEKPPADTCKQNIHFANQLAYLKECYSSWGSMNQRNFSLYNSNSYATLVKTFRRFWRSVVNFYYQRFQFSANFDKMECLVLFRKRKKGNFLNWIVFTPKYGFWPLERLVTFRRS